MEEVQSVSSNYQFLVLAGILLLVGISRQLEPERVSMFLRSFTNGNLVDQQLRQERAFSRLALLAFLFTLLTIACFLSIAAHQFGLLQDFTFIGLCALLIVLIFFITTARVAIYAFIAWLFQLDKLQQQHTYHWLLSNVIGSLILLPVTAMAEFGPKFLSASLVYVGIGVLVLVNLIRLIRTSYISLGEFSIKFGYYFLYICALEILPLAICTAVILRQIGG